MSQLRSVSFRCRGHAEIRGSHHKSVEFTRDHEITARATCVLGVAADVDPHALAGFRGPVTVTITAGAASDVVRAVANPAFEPDGGILLRTSRHASQDTFAVDADKGADELDRDLIAELSRPEAIVTVAVEEETASGRPARGRLTVVAMPGHQPEHLTSNIREVCTQADVLMAAETRPARRLLADAGIAATVRTHEDVDVWARLRADEQLVFPTTAGSEREALAAVADAATETNAAVRILPEPSLETTALVAAGSDAGPSVTLARSHPGQQARTQMLALAANTGTCLVWRETGETLSDALAHVETVLEDRPIRACLAVASRQGHLLRGTAAELRRQWHQLGRPPGEATLVVAGTGGVSRAEPAGETDALLSALLDEGVSARTVAQALASLPGHDYRSQYRRVLRLKSGDG